MPGQERDAEPEAPTQGADAAETEGQKRARAWMKLRHHQLDETWRTWTAHLSMPPVTARMNAEQWVQWAEEGLQNELKAAVQLTIEAGAGIRAPAAYLRKVMQETQAARMERERRAQQAQMAQLLRPQVRMGQIVQLRDGRQAKVTQQHDLETTVLADGLQVIDIPHTQWHLMVRTEEHAAEHAALRRAT